MWKSRHDSTDSNFQISRSTSPFSEVKKSYELGFGVGVQPSITTEAIITIINYDGDIAAFHEHYNVYRVVGYRLEKGWRFDAQRFNLGRRGI